MTILGETLLSPTLDHEPPIEEGMPRSVRGHQKLYLGIILETDQKDCLGTS